MNLNYRFYNDISKFQVKNSEILESSDYYCLMIYNLSFLLSGETSFGLSNYTCENGTIKLKVIFKNKTKMEITTNEQNISVTYNNIHYLFRHNYITEGTDIRLIQIYYYDKQILEEFKVHKIALSRQINDRIYKLEIPIETNKTINPNILKSLTYYSTILDLENIYYNYFYHWQQNEPYNYTKDTNLIIYDILGDDYKIFEEEKLTQGEVYFKQYSKKIGDITINISLKENAEPLITINGFNSKSNIDLNAEVRFLLKKVEKNVAPKLKLIK